MVSTKRSASYPAYACVQFLLRLFSALRRHLGASLAHARQFQIAVGCCVSDMPCCEGEGRAVGVSLVTPPRLPPILSLCLARALFNFCTFWRSPGTIKYGVMCSASRRRLCARATKVAQTGPRSMLARRMVFLSLPCARAPHILLSVPFSNLLSLLPPLPRSLLQSPPPPPPPLTPRSVPPQVSA
jgi:hypothetical protein